MRSARRPAALLLAHGGRTPARAAPPPQPATGAAKQSVRGPRSFRRSATRRHGAQAAAPRRSGLPTSGSPRRPVCAHAETATAEAAARVAALADRRRDAAGAAGRTRARLRAVAAVDRTAVDVSRRDAARRAGAAGTGTARRARAGRPLAPTRNRGRGAARGGGDGCRAPGADDRRVAAARRRRSGPGRRGQRAR